MFCNASASDTNRSHFATPAATLARDPTTTGEPVDLLFGRLALDASTCQGVPLFTTRAPGFSFEFLRPPQDIHRAWLGVLELGTSDCERARYGCAWPMLQRQLRTENIGRLQRTNCLATTTGPLQQLACNVPDTCVGLGRQIRQHRTVVRKRLSHVVPLRVNCGRPVCWERLVVAWTTTFATDTAVVLLANCTTDHESFITWCPVTTTPVLSSNAQQRLPLLLGAACCGTSEKSNFSICSPQMPNSGCPSCWEQLVVVRLRSPSSSGDILAERSRRKTTPPEKNCDRFPTQTTVGGSVSCWLLIVEQRGSLRMERHNAAMVQLAV